LTKPSKYQIRCFNNWVKRGIYLVKEMFNELSVNINNAETDKVSIVIPFYNCRYIARSITSALNQSYKNIEIIVVDDGSSEHVELLRPFINKIVYIKKRNGGTATALNQGITHSSGDYVIWLSSDDLLYGTKVDVQLDFMKKNNFMFSFTDYRYINDKNQIISPSITPKFSNKASLLDGLKNGCPINGSTIMMKRELFSSVGLFDESLVYAHDYDYWIRTFLKFDIGYLDQPLTLYRLHRKMGSKKHAKKICEETDIIQNRYKKVLDEFHLQE